MDTGKGRFEMLKDLESALAASEEERRKGVEIAKSEMEKAHPSHGGWFQVGEILEIRGSKFRVKSIKPTEIRLKLLPKE
jgi:uncharacterized Zn finger protein